MSNPLKKNKKRSNQETCLWLSDEALYREWWRFTYATLKVQTPESHLQSAQVLSNLASISHRYDLLLGTLRPTNQSYGDFLIELSNALVYEYYLMENRAPLNLGYESSVTKFNNLLSKLDSIELQFVRELYKETCHHGFLITALYKNPYVGMCWGAFVNKVAISFEIIRTHKTYPYPKDNSIDESVQVRIEPYEKKIEDGWDLEVYFKKGDKCTVLEKEIRNLSKRWRSGQHEVIGKKSTSSISFFISRKKCTVNWAMEVIKSQIYALEKSYNFPNPSAALKKDVIDLKTYSVQAKGNSEESYSNISNIKSARNLKKQNTEAKKHNRQVEREFSLYNNYLRYSHRLFGKRRHLKADMSRRAVGLEIWIRAVEYRFDDIRVGEICDLVLSELVDQNEISQRINDADLADDADQLPNRIISPLEFYSSRYNHYVPNDDISDDDNSFRDPLGGFPPRDFKDYTRAEESTTKDTLRRLMMDDYYLTKHCIELGDYRPPLEHRPTKE